jgi:hypothetical protein
MDMVRVGVAAEAPLLLRRATEDYDIVVVCETRYSLKRRRCGGADDWVVCGTARGTKWFVGSPSQQSPSLWIPGGQYAEQAVASGYYVVGNSDDEDCGD